MTNNKQTAVEWFWNQLPEILPFTVDTETAVKLQKAYQQSKEMEKEQAQHWFKFGMLLVEGHLWKPMDKFEQYYNENNEQNNQSNQEHV
jgi:hypothetical protein